MHARIPLDVDLEDRLLYGLTPVRLVYLVVGLLAGFATWSTHWAPAPVRGCAAVVIAAAGAIMAWGRWRGRPIDRWIADLTTFTIANYRLRWRLPHRLTSR
ncbi:MAG TPA: PrgI family protein [Candidatus Limnocylindrales bacterium]|nr:PrgI family protein [Candidatus Limnocylindrales bacterium]